MLVAERTSQIAVTMQQKDFAMKMFSSVSRLGLLTTSLASVLLASSCTNPTQSQPAGAAAAPSEIGRYQVSVVNEGDRGTFVILVDTKEGATWIYRPPQAPAINGFWSDIPRLTYAPDYWRNVFTQQGGQQGAPPAGGALQQPAPSTGTAPPPPKR
jgi:hypothetical protein